LVALGALGDAPASGPRASLLARAAAERAGAFVEAQICEADPHVVFFTSGSTGAPKGVVLSHRASWLRSFQGVFVDAPETSVCMFPLFHMAAFTLALAAWQTGGEIALASPAPDDLLRAIEHRRATRFYGLPAIWGRLLEHGLERADVSSLRMADTGTSAVPPELVDALAERLPHATLRIYYGSTEAGAGTALAHADARRKPGRVGLPVPGVELALCDDGEIELRSPFLMDGYFENEAATRAALVGGAYRTGDLGALDDEGYLSVVGRKRDVIRTGGETVAPAEVEAVLGAHPDVEEVAVVGIPDAAWGEIVCAVVVARAGRAPTLETLVAFARDRLARFKLPRRLEIVDALPRTPATRQIQRPLVVERILACDAAR
ncbi:MAG: long-chain fatty acid--CoA ligase, partial [Myxococcales bacterium]|nr:long-chain fatty acid--CoA ligase [Myxococcales bacterium]